MPGNFIEGAKTLIVRELSDVIGSWRHAKGNG